MSGEPPPPPPPEDAYEQLLHRQILEGQARQANPDRCLTLDEAGVERLAAALAPSFGPSYFPGKHDVTIFGESPQEVARVIIEWLRAVEG